MIDENDNLAISVDDAHINYVQEMAQKGLDKKVFNIFVETIISELEEYFPLEEMQNPTQLFQEGDGMGAIMGYLSEFGLDSHVAAINGNQNYYEEYMGECHSPNNPRGLRWELRESAQISVRNEVCNRMVERGILPEDAW